MKTEFDGKAIEITDSNFEDAKKKYPLFILDFWANWCPPCKIMIPIMESLAEEHKGKVVFGKINVDENSEVPRKFSVMSIPTFLIFKNGKLVDTLIGAMSQEAFNSKIESYL